MTTADVIVIGLGGMGTAAAWRLAQRGLSVLGLEQFAVGHDRGSSHGQTRIIRQAYYEHPAYVPLVRRAYEGWYELEQAQGLHLLTACPCLTLGPAAGELVAGVRRSAEEHQLPVEDLSAAEVQRRFPAFDLGSAGEVVGVVEHTSGFLYVDRCVRAMADEARRLGADLREDEPALGWEREGAGFVVRTPAGRHGAGRLVLTCGPWAGRLLGEAGRPLTVMRQVALWHGSARQDLFRRDRFPLFIADTPEGYFYGVPAIDRRGVKVARHYGAPELPGPEAVSREVTDQDREAVAGFLRCYLPAAGACTDGSVCLYTLTPDRHFLIDLYPGVEGVAVAAGFSGHGFKFAPVVGEVLADLAAGGNTPWPIELFRLERLRGGGAG
jgi:sarcosine oxidase